MKKNTDLTERVNGKAHVDFFKYWSMSGGSGSGTVVGGWGNKKCALLREREKKDMRRMTAVATKTKPKGYRGVYKLHE